MQKFDCPELELIFSIFADLKLQDRLQEEIQDRELKLFQANSETFLKTAPTCHSEAGSDPLTMPTPAYREIRCSKPLLFLPWSELL